LREDIHIAVHLRRGDVFKHKEHLRRAYQEGAVQGLLGEIIETAASLANEKGLKQEISVVDHDNSVLRRLVFTLYSEGKQEDFVGYDAFFKQYPAIRYRLILSGLDVITQQLMIESDVFVMGRSSMSIIPCFFNPHSLKLQDPTFRPFPLLNGRCCNNTIEMAVKHNNRDPYNYSNQTIHISNTTLFKLKLLEIIKEKQTVPLVQRDGLFLNYKDENWFDRKYWNMHA